MEEVFERGGVRIGRLHATWPFCDIRVDKNLLQLNASIIGKLVFRPGDIEEIKVVDGFFKGKGIRIVHRVPGYKSNILFQVRSTKNPYELLERIKSTGFLGNHHPIPMEDEFIAEDHQRTGMFSMKPAFAIGVIAAWYVPVIINMDKLIHDGKIVLFESGNRMVYGFGFLMLIVLSLLFIPRFQEFALKPGRNIKDMRIFLIFTLLFFSLFFCLDFLIPHSPGK